ncbi:MAG: isoleucine--tRNA ligase [bacterium]|nr:isoleucine--tRNA ligase [bacterium]
MKAVSTNISFPALEEKILAYWTEKDIFQRSMAADASIYCIGGEGKTGSRPSYVFYDGPPFATGLPHYGHLLAGTIKDVVGRFYTMKGFHVDRRFGWDCHGVPVEFEIQKALDLHGAKAIREFGVGRFNDECRSIVQRYTEEWKKFVTRSGRWVDFQRQYLTMDKDFMESIWWVVKQLWGKGLITEGFKCVPYSPAINTPLSNFEANLNYKDVQDPAVVVRFALITEELSRILGVTLPDGAQVSAYAWTTTPWTLPSNMALAVGPGVTYAALKLPETGAVAICARERAAEHFPELFNKKGEVAEGAILGEFSGESLVGLEYKPLFPWFEHCRAENAFRIYGADYVSADDGTGIVHLASFGEEDLKIFLEKGIPVIDPVDEDGCFTEEVPDFAGRHVKEADGDIIRALRQKGLLHSHKTIVHSYPFCWRTDTPLIYKPISSWFVKVESFREQIQQMNSEVHWVPEHIRDGRMGKWLEGARDWAISRNRFWGTPLPVWRCEECKSDRCIGSVDELEKETGEVISDLHSHFIDHLTITCSGCGGKMKRISEVLDCWFESGSMPYAQAHYPFENKEEFEASFPADFIAEGLDQTRGWFYTLLVLGTALFGKPAFKNVIVNGILLAEDGKKMSKSLRNYPPPDEVMNELGADAMRLYLLASAATRAEELRFSKQGVRDVVRQHLLPLWNAYNFFVTYALVDGWSAENVPDKPSDNILDRWIMSKLGSLISGVDGALGSYHLYSATQPILEFIDQLTNWYIRLNRRRFWGGAELSENIDKQQAYATLHRALLTFVRVMAPLAPFSSEEIFLNLAGGVPGLDCDSVHMTGFPQASEFEVSGAEGDVEFLLQIDRQLELAMELFEDVILAGRSIRNDLGIKLRQPLSSLKIVHPQQSALDGLKTLDSYIREELNVKQVVYTTCEEGLVVLQARLNTKLLGKVLGPKLGGKGMKALQDAVQELDSAEICAVEEGGTIDISGERLTAAELLITRDLLPGAEAAQTSGRVTVQYDTVMTKELQLEGLAREFINRIQRQRKDGGFEVTDRIRLSYVTGAVILREALEAHRENIMSEVLAIEMSLVDDLSEPSVEGRAVLSTPQEIDGAEISFILEKAY